MPCDRVGHLTARGHLTLRRSTTSGANGSKRRVKLSRLLARPDGIRFSEHLAGDGARVFEHACRLGLEGIVSKRRDAPYRSGRSKAWVKVKNAESPAVLRLDGVT
jgi:ATP-dependent DNA ligase